LKGELSPSWKGGKIRCICQQCGEEFEAYFSTLKIGKGKFCSQECYASWLSESMKGENSIFWKGGISFFPYCKKFNNEFKERVRDFFERICFLCGKTEVENNRKLDVHHVTYDKKICCNNKISFFVPFCRCCHVMTNGNRSFWENYLTDILLSEYGGQCFERKKRKKSLMDETEEIEILKEALRDAHDILRNV